METACKIFFLFLLCFCFYAIAIAQTPNATDTLHLKALDSIVITASVRFNQTPYLSAVEGMTIYSGKKTNFVLIDPANANLAQNVLRQLFAQIPGLIIWDMDGAGTQINIGSRGADTHRSIEMNMRQNG